MNHPSDKYTDELELKGINIIRSLAMDAPRAANSGHQGTAMALAPLAHVLFTRILKYNPLNPLWADRDRFILSCGHASILHYSMLYLTGYPLKLEDIKQFRQLGSLTPGHPEAGHTPGIEVTTGPLGQGFANSVGMAIAEKHLANSYPELVDHYTYTIVSDGDLQEGISHEAGSLAGHLGLNKLIAIYDDNRITIDGSTDLSMSDNTQERFESYGWDVNNIGNASEDLDLLTTTIKQAQETDKPSLIIMQSQIGFPSPDLTGNYKAHGLAFDDEEISKTKEVMQVKDEPFWIPEDVLNMYRDYGMRNEKLYDEWIQKLDQSSQTQETFQINPDTSTVKIDYKFDENTKIATRKASQICLDQVSQQFKNTLGGSADLTGNTGLHIDDNVFTKDNPSGRQIFFGIREHAKAAVLVGMARHGGILPVGGTFLIFSDYMKPSIRVAALSKAKCIFVFTHDSIGVGEDGPTHQPIEQLMSLRAIPNLQVIRPADAKETIGAWESALNYDGPTALILTRQDVPVLTDSQKDISQGGYIVGKANNNVDIVFLSTGSEVSLCLDAQEELADQGITARVVSLPNWSNFDKQEKNYRSDILTDLPKISIEAGVTLGWCKYAENNIGVDTFGVSAPAIKAFQYVGITKEALIEASQKLLYPDRNK